MHDLTMARSVLQVDVPCKSLMFIKGAVISVDLMDQCMLSGSLLRLTRNLVCGAEHERLEWYRT